MKEYLSLAKYFFGLCVLAAGTGLLYAHIETQRLVIVNKSQATQGVLAKAECAPNVFQEVRVMLPDGRQFEVTGEGVAPGGEITGHAGTEVDVKGQETLRELCVAGVLANESHLDYSGGEWVSQGDIVDIAFLVMAKKLGMSITDLRTRQEQVALIPYESEKAYSGVVNRIGDQTVIYAKGSPEKMLSMCNRMAARAGPRSASGRSALFSFQARRGSGSRAWRSADSGPPSLESENSSS